MDWRAKVDLFEQLRREHEFGIGTITGVARSLAFTGGWCARHWSMRAAEAPLPDAPSRSWARSRCSLMRFWPRIARRRASSGIPRVGCIVASWRRFPDATVAESTVRNHVRERKRQMGLMRRETFVPQSYVWGQEAQVDWYEAGRSRRRADTLQVFAMRSWPAVRRSTAPTSMRHSRRSSKRMSTPLPISAASFGCFAMTI